MCGLSAGNITKRLLAEAKLTLKKAIDIATAMEAAAKDAVEFQQQNKQESSVHKVATRHHAASTTCYRCGRTGHSPNQCRFKDATCHGCNKKGHIRPACRSQHDQQPSRGPPKPQKGKQKSKPMKLMETTENDDDDDDSTVFVGRFAINKLYQKKDNTIWVTLSINGTPLRMELDTGSAVSIISKGDYLQKFSNLELHSTQVKLKTYTGGKITPVGLLRVSIVTTYQGQQFGGELYVIDRGGSALFGRDWLTHLKLDWPNILAMSVENQVDTAAKLKALIEEYDELFKEEIGELKGIKGNLVLKDNAQPVFLKARQVPYALRPKIEAELVKLQRENIITPVETSEWATPVVPVAKKSGGVRICGDFKVNCDTCRWTAIQ